MANSTLRRSLLAAVQGYLIGLANLDEQPLWIRMWNNQFDKMKEEPVDGEGKIYGITCPAVFLEIIVNEPIQQLCNGCQLYDFDFVLHYIHKQLDAGDNETVDQDLEVFDKVQENFNLVQGQWINTGFGQVFRIGELEDENHDDLYHFQQRFTSTFVDGDQNQPVGAVQSVPPTVPDLSGVVIDNNPADYPN